MAFMCMRRNIHIFAPISLKSCELLLRKSLTAKMRLSKSKLSRSADLFFFFRMDDIVKVVLQMHFTVTFISGPDWWNSPLMPRWFWPAVPDYKVQSFTALTGINTNRTSLSINTDWALTRVCICHVIHQQRSKAQPRHVSCYSLSLSLQWCSIGVNSSFSSILMLSKHGLNCGCVWGCLCVVAL